MNDTTYFQKDKALEEAMIKTCLLYDTSSTIHRESVFQKKLLSCLFLGLYDTADKAVQLLKSEMPYDTIDRGKVDAAINKLVKDNFVQRDEEGKISLTEEAKNKSKTYADNQREQVEKIVDDIYQDVKKNVNPIQNEAQVRENIKECIDYYIRVSAYKFIGLDDSKKINELPELEKKASWNLGGNDNLKDQIILSIGNLIDRPTDEQSSTLEVMARCLITMRLLGMDFMFNNFKQSTLRHKVFVLDTDYLLYLITDHGELSRCYKALLDQLYASGCKMYVPNEIISEVFDHAEAATKRYHFVNPLLASNPGSWADQHINNVFLEAYYEQKEKDIDYPWSTYIANYYNKKAGEAFTEAVIREYLSKYPHIEIGKMPEDYKLYDDTNEEMVAWRNLLYEKAYAATLQTAKAENRDDMKNEQIAKTDTMLYLSMKRLNEYDASRESISDLRDDLLQHRYYVITNTFRIYPCAQELGLHDKPFCKPASLMAYLLEAGIIAKNKVKITSLFDNPFLLFIAEKSWDDAEKFAKAGINFSRVSIVKLRYDLQDHLEQLLTSTPGTPEYSNAVDEVKAKGYSFVSQIEYAKRLQDDLLEKEEQIASLTAEVERLKANNAKVRHQNLAERLSKRTKGK